MADYATHTDIEDLIPGRPAFTSTTKPTDAQVDGYCAEVTQELNGILKAAGYAVPVTNTNALKLVKLWCLYKVAYLTERARFPERKSAELDNAQDYLAQYNDALDLIRANELDAPLTSDLSGGAPTSYWTNHPEDTDALDPVTTFSEEF